MISIKLLNCNFHMLLCGKQSLKKNDCYWPMVGCVRVQFTYSRLKRSKTDVLVLTLRSFRHLAKISN
jgi:hypothetical protein